MVEIDYLWIRARLGLFSSSSWNNPWLLCINTQANQIGRNHCLGRMTAACLPRFLKGKATIVDALLQLFVRPG